ncbi:MAG: hypothetical protein ACREQF_01540 [Candidatus Binataceae bacterium]
MTSQPSRPQPSNFAIARAAAIALLLLAAGCTSGNTPSAAADRFIDAYYVTINLAQAAKVSRGLALDKINQEIALTKGQTIDAATRKPSVHYKLQSRRDEDNAITFIYKARFDVPDAGTFERNLMITTRNEGGTWIVSNFSEFE